MSEALHYNVDYMLMVAWDAVIGFFIDYGKTILAFIFGIYGGLAINFASNTLIERVKNKKFKSHLYKETHFNYYVLCKWLDSRVSNSMTYIERKDYSPPLISGAIYQRVISNSDIIDFFESSENSRDGMHALLKLGAIYKELNLEIESYKNFVSSIKADVIELHNNPELVDSLQQEYKTHLNKIDALRRQLKEPKHAIFGKGETIY
jgi:hypothetical protein